MKIVLAAIVLFALVLGFAVIASLAAIPLGFLAYPVEGVRTWAAPVLEREAYLAHRERVAGWSDTELRAAGSIYTEPGQRSLRRAARDELAERRKRG